MSVDIKNFLKKYNFRPNDLLGQNFLIDEIALQDIVDQAELSKDDQVLEIGSGIGNLTKLLTEQAGFVLAVEKDQRYLPILRDLLGKDAFANQADKETRKQPTNVQVVFADITQFNFQELLKPGYVVVANIPYYITGKIVEMLVTAKVKPRRIVLLMQKEVAQRICAKPGNLSILAISVQLFGTPRMGQIIPRDSFYPAPDVDSAVLVIDLFEKLPFAPDQKKFFKMIKAAFAGKRKQIHNTLETNLQLPKEAVESALQAAEVPPTERPQDLTLAQWQALYTYFVDSDLI